MQAEIHPINKAHKVRSLSGGRLSYFWTITDAHAFMLEMVGIQVSTFHWVGNTQFYIQLSGRDNTWGVCQLSGRRLSRGRGVQWRKPEGRKASFLLPCGGSGTSCVTLTHCLSLSVLGPQGHCIPTPSLGKWRNPELASQLHCRAKFQTKV